MKAARRFPLGVQVTLPENYQADADFSEIMSLARENGLAELELNLLEPDEINLDELADFLKGFGLSMTRLATGGFAKRRGLSLSSGNEKIRGNAVARTVGLVRTARLRAWEVIVGFLKGAPDGDTAAARKRFRRSLFEIAEACGPGPLPIVVEATNRYESPVANTLQEAADLTSAYLPRGIRILPDTFHMNIEEANTSEALRLFHGRYHSLHISDNNRLLPGFGAIDFAPIFRLLSEIGYGGSLVIEGNVRESLRDDLEASIRFIDRLIGPAGRDQEG
jgi:5-keto-L-gluconate epimerase